MEFNINDWLINNQDYLRRVVIYNTTNKSRYEDLKQDATLFCLEKAKYFEPQRKVSFKTYIHKALVRFIKLTNNKYKDSIHRTNQLYEYLPLITARMLDANGCIKDELTIEDIRNIYPNLAVSEAQEVLKLVRVPNIVVGLTDDFLKVLPDNKNDMAAIENKIDIELEFKQRVLDSRILSLRSRREFLKYLDAAITKGERNVQEFARSQDKHRRNCSERIYSNTAKVKQATVLRHQLTKGYYNGKYLLSHNINDILSRLQGSIGANT